MQSQLQAIADDFAAASVRFDRLAASVPEPLWTRRPRPDSWSPAECVAHLNLTASAFLPLLRDGLAQAPPAPVPRRYRHGFAGWLLWKVLGPPVRFRTKTSQPFVPLETGDREALVREFRELHAAQLACLHEADGHAVDAVLIASPFNARVKYNVFAALAILPRHEHRHLWQAEQAVVAAAGRQG